MGTPSHARRGGWGAEGHVVGTWQPRARRPNAPLPSPQPLSLPLCHASTPDARPWPMSDDPAPCITARTSAKSTFTSPGTCSSGGAQGYSPGRARQAGSREARGLPQRLAKASHPPQLGTTSSSTPVHHRCTPLLFMPLSGGRPTSPWPMCVLRCCCAAHRDDVRDAAHALAQHVVCNTECLGHLRGAHRVHVGKAQVLRPSCAPGSRAAC